MASSVIINSQYFAYCIIFKIKSSTGTLFLSSIIGPQILQYYTMTLHRPRALVIDARFKPETGASAAVLSSRSNFDRAPLLSRLVFYEPTHLLDYRLEMSRQNLIILMVIRILTHYPKIISDIVKRLS